MLRPFDHNLNVSLLPPATGDNNVDTANLLKFITKLYHPHIDSGLYIQLYVCIVLTMGVVFLATAVILNRIYGGRAWFLKIWRVAGGTFVIPNSVMAFLVCQFWFATVWLAYTFITIQYYRERTFQKNYFLWKILIWSPLWCGGWLNAFGVLSTFPDALTRKSKGGVQRRLILSPFAFNTSCWFVPVVQMASILPPAILANRTHNRTLDDFNAWSKAIEVAQHGSISDTTAARLHNRALELWLDVTKAYWYLEIAFTCWCVWALVCLIIYGPVGAHTLLRIQAQLKLARKKERDQKALDLEAMEGTAKETENRQSDSQKARLDDNINPTTTYVFPPIKEPPVTHRASTMRFRTVEQRRTHNLDRVYKNLSVQYYGISSAILVFFMSSAVYAIGAYDGARNNKIAPIQNGGNLSAAWAIVTFGFLTMWCIFWRSFDPSLSIDISEEESLFQARSMVVAFKNRALQLVRLRRNEDAEDSRASSPAVNAGTVSDRAASQHVSWRGPDDTHSSHTRVSATIDRQTSVGKLKCASAASLNRCPTSSQPAGCGYCPGCVAEATHESGATLAPVYYATPFGKIPSARGQVRVTPEGGEADLNQS